MAAGAAVFGCAALAPALAEDSGLWDVIHANAPTIRAVAPQPGFSIFYPSVERVAPQPRVVRLPSSQVSNPPPATPPDPSKRENPLRALLRDHTLRYGDIVMFPDGPRVFKGQPGDWHDVRDFVALSGSKELSPAGRKVLAMPVGHNDAWSYDINTRTAKVARRAADVETTGSTGKTVTVRAGRDVRVIRVPD